MPEVWTQERAISLAPDAASARAGRELADARRWQGLGVSDRALWGECQGSGKTPYQARIDLAEPAFKCSCPSRKFPCKHGIGLLLLYAREADRFPATVPPEWVASWLASRDERAEKQTAKRDRPADGPPADPAAQAKRAAKREDNVAAGLDELDAWMRDLISGGLAAARARPKAYWEAMAARLVDTQAPGLARLVREIPATAASGEGWQTRVLERLARIHMIASAHRRAAALPEALRAEVRAAVGWTVPKEEVLARDGVRDRWLVVGRRIDQEDRVRVQRTWLWAAAADRPALVLDFAPGPASLDASLVVGTSFEGEIAYYPGAASMRGVVKARDGTKPLPDTLPGEPGVAAALGRFAVLVGACPWIERTLIALRAVTPMVRGGGLLLADRDGRALPIAPAFRKPWQLVAISGGRPLHVFGEWDGERLLPLGVAHGDAFHDFGPRGTE